MCFDKYLFIRQFPDMCLEITGRKQLSLSALVAQQLPQGVRVMGHSFVAQKLSILPIRHGFKSVILGQLP